MLQQLDQRVQADHLRQAADEGGAGPVAAGVDDPGTRMRRLEPEAEPPIGAAIEAGAQGEQLVNPVRAFTCEDSDGFGVGQAVTGGQGVGRMLAGAVAGAEGHRDAALRPGAGAVGERFLGDHDRRLSLGSQPPGRPEAGDARSDDHGASGHGGNIVGERRVT